MADDRNRNPGQRDGMYQGHRGDSHQSPGRNPQDERSAGERRGENRGRGDYDPSRGGDGGRYKEGGQNEQTRR